MLLKIGKISYSFLKEENMSAAVACKEIYIIQVISHDKVISHNVNFIVSDGYGQNWRPLLSSKKDTEKTHVL